MKRILLISLLLILVLGFSASALDLPKIPSSLKIELVVPENIQVGEPFWVDVYLTPFFKETIGGTSIYLETSSSDLYFVGNIWQGDISIAGLQQGDIFDNVKLIEIDPEAKDQVRIESKGKLMALQGKKKMASVKMMANKAGTYSINLLKEPSYSFFDEVNSQEYLLNMPTTTACIPISKCPNSFDCGYKDDGCGKALKCNACDQPKYCVDNFCTDLVVVSQNSNDITLCKTVLATNPNEKTLLTKISSALKEYKDYKIEFNEIVKALVEWFKAAKVPQP